MNKYCYVISFPDSGCDMGRNLYESSREAIIAGKEYAFGNPSYQGLEYSVDSHHVSDVIEHFSKFGKPSAILINRQINRQRGKIK